MPHNIFTVDLGELSATSSAALSELEGRVDTAEGRLDDAEGEITGIKNDIASMNISANPYLLNKIHLASGVLFGQFITGYYNMKAQSSSILTVYPSEASMCCVMSCAPGDILHIRAGGYSTYGTYVFLNSSNAVIGNLFTGTSNGSAIITAPAGAAKVIVNSMTSYADPYVAIGTYTEDDITDINNRMDDIILMQSNRPSSQSNVLWVDSDDVTEISVLTTADVTPIANSTINALFD